MAILQEVFAGIKSAVLGQPAPKQFTGQIPNYVKDQPIAKEWNDLNAVSSGYKASTYVYRAIGWKAKGFAQIDMNLVSYADDGSRQIIDSHELVNLWERPNPFMGGAEFRERIVQFLELSGNAPIFKQRGVGGRVVALYPVAPAWLTPIADSNKVLSGYLYENGGERLFIEPKDLILIQYPDPANPLWGTSPLKVVGATVDTDTAAVQWNKQSLDNRAVPDGVMVANQDLTEAQYDTAVEKWHEQRTRAANAHKTLFVSGEWTYQSMANTAVEMDFIASRKMTREEITAAFGVPLILLGILDNATYSNYKEARLSFWEDTEQPLIDTLLQGLTFGLAREFDENLFFEADYSRIPALKEKQLSQAEQALKFMQLGYSRNEVNAKLDLGFDDDPKGNQKYIPSGLIPEDFAGAAHLDITETGDIENPPINEQPASGEDLAQSLAALQQQTETQGKAIDAFFLKAASDDEEAAYLAAELKEWKRIERKRSPFDSYFNNEVRKQFKRERSEVLKRLKSSGVPAARDYIKSNQNRTEWRKAFASFYRRTITEFGRVGTDDIKAMYPEEVKAEGWTFDPYSAAIQKWVKVYAARKVTHVLDTTKAMLSLVIAKALEPDEEGNRGSMDDVAAQIGKLYDGHFDPHRSFTISRTEVAGASNFGLFAAGQQAPFEVEKNWVNSGDERVRHKHDFRQTVGMNEKFKNGLLYPADPAGSAAEVIQCRCTMRHSRKRARLLP